MRKVARDCRSSFGRNLRGAALAALAAWVVTCSAANAGAVPAIGICGDATGDGVIDTTDALFTLQAAVGARVGDLMRSDCNSSGSVTAGDAIAILRVAVGLPGVLACPLPATTTTTTIVSSTSTTTTSLPGGCGNGIVEAGEDCEPPLGFCRGGCNLFTRLCVDYQCSSACTCPDPFCGDYVIDLQEECDPPGSGCDGGTCNSSCGCDTGP